MSLTSAAGSAGPGVSYTLATVLKTPRMTLQEMH
jgi:hypothetical protein